MNIEFWKALYAAIIICVVGNYSVLSQVASTRQLLTSSSSVPTESTQIASLIGKEIPVNVNGRNFRLLNLRDGRRVLVFVDQQGKMRQVQTLSGPTANFNRDHGSNVGFMRAANTSARFINSSPKPAILSERKRNVLEKLRTQLNNIVELRVDPGNFKIVRLANSDIQLARVQNKNDRGLTNKDVLEMLRTINIRLANRNDINISPSSQFRSNVPNTLRVSWPSTKTNVGRQTNVKPIRIFVSSNPRMTSQNQRLQNKKEDDTLKQLRTLPGIILSADRQHLLRKLKSEDRQIIQELENLERSAPVTTTGNSAGRRSIDPVSIRSQNGKTADDSVMKENSLLPNLKVKGNQIINQLHNLEQNRKIRLQKELTGTNIGRNLGLTSLNKDRSLNKLKAEEISILRQLQSLRLKNGAEVDSSRGLSPKQMSKSKPRQTPLANTQVPFSITAKDLDTIILSMQNILSRNEKTVIMNLLQSLIAGNDVIPDSNVEIIIDKLRREMIPTDYELLVSLLQAKGYTTRTGTKTLSLEPSFGNVMVRKASNNVDGSQISNSLIPHEAANVNTNKNNVLHNTVSPELMQIIDGVFHLLSPAEQTEVQRQLATIKHGSSTQIQPQQTQAPSTSNIQTSLLSSLQQLLPPDQFSHLQLLLGGQKSHMTSQQVPGLIQSPQMNVLQHTLPNPLIQQAMLHQTSHLFPRSPFGGTANLMNPFGLPSAMMQELMFGDTTDPPDPVEPIQKGNNANGAIEAEDLPPTTTTTTTTLPPPKPLPIQIKNNTIPSQWSQQVGDIGKSIINALKSSGLPNNVKLEFHLPAGNGTSNVPRLQMIPLTNNKTIPKIAFPPKQPAPRMNNHEPKQDISNVVQSVSKKTQSINPRNSQRNHPNHNVSQKPFNVAIKWDDISKQIKATKQTSVNAFSFSSDHHRPLEKVVPKDFGVEVNSQRNMHAHVGFSPMKTVPRVKAIPSDGSSSRSVEHNQNHFQLAQKTNHLVSVHTNPGHVTFKLPDVSNLQVSNHAGSNNQHRMISNSMPRASHVAFQYQHNVNTDRNENPTHQLLGISLSSQTKQNDKNNKFHPLDEGVISLPNTLGASGIPRLHTMQSETPTVEIKRHEMKLNADDRWHDKINNVHIGLTNHNTVPKFKWKNEHSNNNIPNVLQSENNQQNANILPPLPSHMRVQAIQNAVPEKTLSRVQTIGSSGINLPNQQSSFVFSHNTQVGLNTNSVKFSMPENNAAAIHVKALDEQPSAVFLSQSTKINPRVLTSNSNNPVSETRQTPSTKANTMVSVHKEPIRISQTDQTTSRNTQFSFGTIKTPGNSFRMKESQALKQRSTFSNSKPIVKIEQTSIAPMTIGFKVQGQQETLTNPLQETSTYQVHAPESVKQFTEPVHHINIPIPQITVQTKEAVNNENLSVSQNSGISHVRAGDSTLGNNVQTHIHNVGSNVHGTSTANQQQINATPAYKVQFHTNQGEIKKISIIPKSNSHNVDFNTPVSSQELIQSSLIQSNRQAVPRTHTIDANVQTPHSQNKMCDPTSPSYYCEGIDMFREVKSIGTWCIGKCLQGKCVETVCTCGCRTDNSIRNDPTLVQNMALAFSGNSIHSAQVKRTLHEMHESLQNNPLITSSAQQNNLAGSPSDVKTFQNASPMVPSGQIPNSSADMKTLLSSIESLIDAKIKSINSNNRHHQQQLNQQRHNQQQQQQYNMNANQMFTQNHPQNHGGEEVESEDLKKSMKNNAEQKHANGEFPSGQSSNNGGNSGGQNNNWQNNNNNNRQQNGNHMNDRNNNFNDFQNNGPHGNNNGGNNNGGNNNGGNNWQNNNGDKNWQSNTNWQNNNGNNDWNNNNGNNWNNNNNGNNGQNSNANNNWQNEQNNGNNNWQNGPNNGNNNWQDGPSNGNNNWQNGPNNGNNNWQNGPNNGNNNWQNGPNNGNNNWQNGPNNGPGDNWNNNGWGNNGPNNNWNGPSGNQGQRNWNNNNNNNNGGWNGPNRNMPPPNQWQGGGSNGPPNGWGGGGGGWGPSSRGEWNMGFSRRSIWSHQGSQRSRGGEAREPAD